MDKKAVKQLLGELPLTVELYWLLRQRSHPLKSRFALKNLQMTLPDVCTQLKRFVPKAPKGKNIFIFATMHFWIEHAAMIGMALAGKGHKVTLAYLPYAEWHKPISKFDLRRQNLYARQVLQEAAPYMKTVSFLDFNPFFQSLPLEIVDAVDQVSLFDTQYTLQVEDFNPQDPVYHLRHERNQAAARAALSWFKGHRPDVVIVPNGTIQEFGVVYRVARHLGIPAVTYEFGDQRDHIWLAQNGEIMRHETNDLWDARRKTPLSTVEVERLNALFSARMQAATWENFSRLWQGIPSQGGSQVRTSLCLDDRPVALLATNVLGDSLTLGRQVFSRSMEEWVRRTVQYFAGRKDIQLVIRVHPGEALTHGTSIVDVVQKLLPQLPENIRLIGPAEKINTYDLMDFADIGLVYTTTVGMEMAMSGKPVVIAGQTHYRGRGFTFDPQTWDAYFDQLKTILANPAAYRLGRDQTDLAWQYAYRFFFEYPLPFPWHLVRFWDDYKAHPIDEVLGGPNADIYDATFRYLAGDPIDWTKGIETLSS